MDIFILKVMQYLGNPELFTVAEMKKNTSDAHAAAYAVYATYAADANAVSAAVSAAVAYTAVAYDTDYTNYWIDQYFKVTGEDKQDYINEVERLR